MVKRLNSGKERESVLKTESRELTCLSSAMRVKYGRNTCALGVMFSQDRAQDALGMESEKVLCLGGM